MGKGGGGCITYTVGYKYSLGIHMAICHGPVDAVLGAKTDTYFPWTGNVTDNGRISINKPELYGGAQREGGVAGEIDIAFGGPGQGVNDYLAQHLAQPLPAFRGVLAMIFRRVYLGDSHYLKNWAWRVRHSTRHPAWSTLHADINGDMNPAHIIYACITSTEWGMGYPSTDINADSFAAAAQRLYDEGFGLSLMWDQSTPIEDFIDEVRRHIDAVLYVEPTTGLWELHLIRDNYDPAALPVLGPDVIIGVESYTRRSQAEMANTFVLKYRRHTDQEDIDESITLHNTAMIQRLGQIIHQSGNFPGISKPSLANRIAARELQNASMDLSSASFTALPAAHVESLREGAPFRFTWPKYGIQEEIMRVVTIDWGTLTDGKVRITAVQDVFAAPTAIYAEVPRTGWTDPVSAPVVVAYRRLEEMPYWEIVRRYGDNEELIATVGEEAGVMMGGFVQPVADAFNFRLYTRPGSGGYVDRGVWDFCPSGMLVDGIGKNATFLTATGMIGIGSVQTNSLAIIGEEWIRIDTLNPVTGHINIARGMLDTVPAEHAAGARVWFVQDHYATDGQDMQSGTTVNARACTITGKGELDPAAAPTDNLTFAARAIRPYPPGRLRINAEAYPAHITGALAVEWRHRDRLQQTAYLVDQDEGDIGPEENTTYRLRVYGENDLLRRTFNNIEGTQQFYPIEQEIADNGALGRPSEALRIVLDARRDGYDSWQAHDHAIAECRGYGMFYGEYYGE